MYLVFLIGIKRTGSAMRVKKVAGVDIGYGSFGICGSQGSRSFVLKTKLKGIEKQKEFVITFLKSKDFSLFKELLNYDFIVIEKPFNIKGYGEILLQLLGMIKYIFFVNDINFVEIPQMTLKKFATGKGNSQKSEMVIRAYKEFNFEAETEDEVDAFWCMKAAECILNQKKFSKSRQDSLKKLIVEYIGKIK